MSGQAAAGSVGQKISDDEHRQTHHQRAGGGDCRESFSRGRWHWPGTAPGRLVMGEALQPFRVLPRSWWAGIVLAEFAAQRS